MLGVLSEAPVGADRRRDARGAPGGLLRRGPHGAQRRRSVRLRLLLGHSLSHTDHKWPRVALGREHPGHRERHQRRHQDSKVQRLGHKRRADPAHLVLLAARLRRRRGDAPHLWISLRFCRKVSQNSVHFLFWLSLLLALFFFNLGMIIESVFKRFYIQCTTQKILYSKLPQHKSCYYTMLKYNFNFFLFVKQQRNHSRRKSLQYSADHSSNCRVHAQGRHWHGKYHRQANDKHLQARSGEDYLIFFFVSFSLIHSKKCRFCWKYIFSLKKYF